jgi:hypothetical protein
MSNSVRITVGLTPDERDFLDLLQHEDAAANLSQAVSWCIDSCMKIEKLYGIDACFIAYNDIRLKENDPNPPHETHLHIKLPSGAVANVSPDASPGLLNALDKMCELAKDMPAEDKTEEISADVMWWKLVIAEIKIIYLPPDSKETVEQTMLQPSTDRLAKFIIEKIAALTTENNSLREALEDVASRIQDVTGYKHFDGVAHTVLANLVSLIRELLAKHPKP